jgi:hypothetical protein
MSFFGEISGTDGNIPEDNHLQMSFLFFFAFMMIRSVFNPILGFRG